METIKLRITAFLLLLVMLAASASPIYVTGSTAKNIDYKSTDYNNMIKNKPAKPSLAKEDTKNTVKLVTGDTLIYLKDKIIVKPGSAQKISYVPLSYKGDNFLIPLSLINHLDKIDINIFNVRLIKLIQDKLQVNNKGNVVRLIVQLNVNPYIGSGKDNIKFQNAVKEVKKVAEKYDASIVGEYKVLPDIVLNVKQIPEVIDLLNELSQLDSVKKVWLDYPVQALLYRDPMEIAESYYYLLNESTDWMGVDTAWSQNITGQGMKIAILDTGIYHHPDLANKITIEKSFVPGEPYYDYYGHGTHVAGIAGGNGTLLSSQKGVAPDVEIWDLKVLSRGGYGYTSWILNAIEYAVLGPDGNITTPDNADVISMSLGAAVPSDGSDPLSQGVDWAFLNGVLPVVAAGNSGPGAMTVGIPASAHYALTVGALYSPENGVAYFSSRGPTLDFRVKPEVIAPGVRIMSASARMSYLEYYAYLGWIPSLDVDGDGLIDYFAISGTSMATPHGSGSAILVKQALEAKGLPSNPATVKALIVSTASSIEGDPLAEGSGLINLTKLFSSPIMVYPALVDLSLIDSTYSDNITVPIDVKGLGLGAEPNTTYTFNVSVTVKELINGVSYNGDNMTVYPDSFTIAYGEEKPLNITLITQKLPVGYDFIEVRLTNNGETIAKIGLSLLKLHKVVINITDPDGNPVPSAPVLVESESDYTTTAGELFEELETTASNGLAVFYLPNGNYSVKTVFKYDGEPVFMYDSMQITSPTVFNLPGQEAYHVALSYPSNLTVILEKIYIEEFTTGEPVMALYPENTGLYVYNGSLELSGGVVYQLVPTDEISPADPFLIKSKYYVVSASFAGIEGDLSVDFSNVNFTHVSHSYALPPDAQGKNLLWIATWLDAYGLSDFADVVKDVEAPSVVDEYYGVTQGDGFLGMFITKAGDLPNRVSPDWDGYTSMSISALYPSNIEMNTFTYPLYPTSFIGFTADPESSSEELTLGIHPFQSIDGTESIVFNYGAYPPTYFKVLYNGSVLYEDFYGWYDYNSVSFAYVPGNYTLLFEQYLEGKQVFDGSYAWYSGDGDYVDRMMVYAVDLSNVSEATLSFATKYSIEEGWDYGYVMISTDGSSWNILDAYTGDSGDWRTEVYDLTPYTGGVVYIGFRYVTDCCYHWGGWWLDDISIPEIGFFDGAEKNSPSAPIVNTGWSKVGQSGFYVKYSVDITVNGSLHFYPEMPSIVVGGLDLWNYADSPVNGYLTTTASNVSLYYSVNGGEWIPVDNLVYNETTGVYEFSFNAPEDGVVSFKVVEELVVNGQETRAVTIYGNALGVRAPKGPSKLTFVLGDPYTDIYAGSQKIATIVKVNDQFRDLFYDPTGVKYTIRITVPGQYIDVFRGPDKLATAGYVEGASEYWNVYDESGSLVAVYHYVGSGFVDVYFKTSDGWVKMATFHKVSSQYIDVFIDQPSLWSNELARLALLMGMDLFEQTGWS